jgi:hypothetical protein
MGTLEVNMDSIAPSLDMFKSICHSVILQIRGRVLGFEQYPIQVPIKSFWNAVIELPYRNESYQILLNRSYPIIAFATDRNIREHGVVGLNHEFVNLPLLHEHIARYYMVLTKDEVEKPLDYNDKRLFSNLSKHELDQIKYRKPSSVGDLIFNFWD